MQPQDSFDVTFCDLCNTSVPLQDLESGAAVRHLGKTIGACCRPALIGGSPRPEAPAAAAVASSRSAVHDARLLPLGIAMLAAIAGATIFLDYRLTSADERWEKSASGLSDTLEANEEVLRGVSVAMDGLVRRSDFDSLGERLAAIDIAGQRLAEQLRSSAELHGQALQRLHEQQRDAERARPDYGPILTELRQQLQQQAVTLAELKAMPRAAEPAPAAAPAPAEPAAPGVPAALQHHIKRLQDEDPATRFEAVDELLRSRDPTMIVHLLPMAKDADTFVRRLTVEGLRDFRHPSAVDALLVALADPEEIVRDTAWRSLKELTGQKFPFEATAARDVRARAQAKWQEWWEKNRESFGS